MASEPSEHLLDLIYDAAIDPALWPAAMQGIADATGAMGGILLGHRSDLSSIEFEHNGGLDPDCNRAYQVAHIQNRWSAEMVRRVPGSVVFSDEILALSELRRTAFHADVLHPQGVGHNAMCAIPVGSRLLVAFNICRSVRQGPFGEDDRARLHALLSHVRRSLALAHRLDGFAAVARSDYRALDMLATGLVLLDATSAVVFANAAADRLIGQDRPLRLMSGRIAAHQPALTRRIDMLVARVLRGTPLASSIIAFPDESRNLSIIASALRRRDLATAGIAHQREPSVVLFLIDPIAAGGIEPGLLREAFGLTVAEERVAAALAAGSGFGQAAADLGLSINTVKTHVSRIYAKTGVSRQAELMRLLTAMAGVRQAPEPHPIG